MGASMSDTGRPILDLVWHDFQDQSAEEIGLELNQVFKGRPRGPAHSTAFLNKLWGLEQRQLPAEQGRLLGSQILNPMISKQHVKLNLLGFHSSEKILAITRIEHNFAEQCL